MTAGLWLPASIALILLVVAYRKGGVPQIGTGLKEGGMLFTQVLPNLVIGFTVAGLLTVLLPRDLVAQWLGSESGVRGLAVGSIAGALTPGGPFTHFPIMKTLLDAGAGVGPVSAYIAAWALIGVHRIVIWETPILGVRFMAARVIACLLMPPIIGVVTQIVFRWMQAPAGK